MTRRPPGGRGAGAAIGWRTGTRLDVILRCPGPVIATTTKPDIFALTSAVRSYRGPVHVFNPQGIGDKLRQGGDPPAGTTAAWAAVEQAVIGKAVDLLSGPGGLASFCAAGSSAPASAAPACRWTSGTPRRSRPGSATR